MDKIFKQPRRNLVNYFTHTLHHANRMRAFGPSPFGTYYEFGTAWGGTLASYILALEAFCKTTDSNPKDFKIVLCDSFAGLPDDDEHPGWKVGQMAVSKGTLLAKLETYEFAKYLIGGIRCVEGYFDTSLTDELSSELKNCPPSIVTIDVDLYTSTQQALSWLPSVMSSGAIIYFDDIWAFHGHPEYGQIRAIREFNERNEIGSLVEFPTYGEQSKSFIYHRHDYEYAS